MTDVKKLILVNNNSMKLYIKNGRVIDPASGRDEIANILIIDGKISQIGKDIE